MNGNHVETRGRDRNAPIVPKPALIRRPARAARKGLAWPPQGGTGVGSYGSEMPVVLFATKARNQIALPIDRNVQQCTCGVETCTA
jgi:hypothetical protein